MNINFLKGTAASVLLALTACVQNTPSDTPANLRTIDLYIGAEKAETPAANGTRIAYDDSVQANWEAGDEITVCAMTADGLAFTTTLTALEAGRQTAFDGQIAIPATSGVTIERIYAYYNGLNVEVRPDYIDGSLRFTVPAEQNGDHAQHNLGLAVMEGPWTIAATETELVINDVIAFTPYFTRLDVNVLNLPAEEQINSISLSLDGYNFSTAGTVRFDDLSGTAEEAIEQTITLRPDAENDLTSNKVGIVPITFDAPTRLNVMIRTASTTSATGHDYTMAFNTPEAFAAATRYTLNVDLAQLAPETLTYLTAENFESAINSNKSGHFVLNEDLAFNAFPNITDFAGTFDGDGHTIDMTAVGSVSSEQAGLFGNTTGNASVANVTIDAGELDGNTGEGGLLVGLVESGTLTLNNVHGSGTITASRHDDAKHMFGGGLVGFVPAGSALIATNCSFTGSISIDQTGYYGNVKNSYVGGIVGSIETGGNFTSGGSYNGNDAGSASQITNCTVTNATLTNVRGEGLIDPDETEFYTGGIAGRCTGLIKDCSVENVTITAESAEDGSHRQAKPIVGNDWNEHVDNANNTYTNVVINGGNARTGVYNGTRAAGTDVPSYSDL